MQTGGKATKWWKTVIHIPAHCSSRVHVDLGLYQAHPADAKVASNSASVEYAGTYHALPKIKPGVTSAMKASWSLSSRDRHRLPSSGARRSNIECCKRCFMKWRSSGPVWRRHTERIS
ncbi:uncharacterized protein BDV14DRAFT_184025 [Aspergillus stella-maris]|uniref:uncharacterized protein n=1 Tax=Aspergillus stella-maris TaxID=1810926 RepID=UPI003CCCBFF7